MNAHSLWLVVVVGSLAALLLILMMLRARTFAKAQANARRRLRLSRAPEVTEAARLKRQRRNARGQRS